MKKQSFFAVLALVISGLIISSCNKKESYNTSFSEDYAYAESVFGDISDISDEAYEKGSKGHKSGDGAGVILSDCAEITINFSSTPYQLIVDFGEENCLCNDDRYRRGKVIVTFDGLYHEAGTTIKHTLENYYVDDDQVEGTKTVINKGLNENKNIWFDVEETGVITKAGDGGTITWNSLRQREWIEGDSTFNIWDDVYLLTGTASGSSDQKTEGSATSLTNSWEMEIMKPLRVELDCRWIPSGSIEINLESIPTALLDYGDGECDRKATLEIDGNTYTIYMK